MIASHIIVAHESPDNSSVASKEGTQETVGQRGKQEILRAELFGSNVCSAAGVTVRDAAPVLAICRALVASGHDPTTPLHVYRGDTLSLRVRFIGEAAKLKINSKGTGFVARRSVRTAPLVRQIDPRGDLPATLPARASLGERPQ